MIVANFPQSLLLLLLLQTVALIISCINSDRSVQSKKEKENSLNVRGSFGDRLMRQSNHDRCNKQSQ